MRYSEHQNTIAIQNRRNEVWNFNKKLLKELGEEYNVVIPEELEQQIFELGKRLEKIVATSYEHFSSYFPGVISREAVCYALREEKEKHWPTCYVYTPELSVAFIAKLDKKMRTDNMKRLTSLLNKSQGIKASEDFCKFILNVLPAEVPFQTFFDGNRQRVANLTDKPEAKQYGDVNNDFFAVVHKVKDDFVVTIFYSGIDYQLELTKRLVKILKVPESVARRVSLALSHDRYYSIRDEIATDFEKYVTQMAYLLKVQPGDTVHDYLQGDTPVVEGCVSKKVAIDIDDELPSAVLVGNCINIYLPKGIYSDTSEE